MLPSFARPKIIGLSPGQFVNSVFISISFVVVLATTYRFLITDARDRYKCNALANDGYWLDSSSSISSHGKPFQLWQPPGCMLHKYAAKDISDCLQSQRIVLVGDSTIRQIFWAIAKKLDPKGAEEDLTKTEKHSDVNLRKSGIGLEFIWDPYLNSTKLHHELTIRRDHSLPTASGQNSTTALLLIGGGLWHARYIALSPFDHFKASIDSIIALLENQNVNHGLNLHTSVVTRPPAGNDYLYLAPVQVPLYEALAPDRASALSAANIDLMNQYLQQLSGHRRIRLLWSYSQMTWHESSAYEKDGLHVVEAVVNQKADVLLNLRCNDVLTTYGHYPFDKTCCTGYGYLLWIQWVMLVTGLGIFPLLLIFATSGSKYARLLPSHNVCQALAVLGLAVCYCFFADRTQLFNKVQKKFSTLEFNVLCLSALAVGLLSLRRSVAPGGPSSGIATRQVTDQPFMSRDQTDEWKGWMQFLILIYHYTGASKVLWIYEIIRVCVAAYLFMTGFGHTVFFYTKGDYSFRRFASVLVRLNLLSCTLPYLMKTNYLFYYFAPLVTFWFVIIYVTMRVGQSKNNSLLFLVCKIMLSALITGAATRKPGLLEYLFDYLEHYLHITWDLTEWRFRLSLDIYVVYAGMLAGILYVRTRAILQSDLKSKFSSSIRRHFGVLQIISTFLSIVVLALYSIATRSFPDKYAYNRWHPYMSSLPILAYIILRNSNLQLRNFHSSVFAWLGRCSLETFTLQFHIWLAADTKGLLSIGYLQKGGGAEKIIDFIVLTPLFLWISWHAASSTTMLTAWIIEPKNFCPSRQTRENVQETNLSFSRMKGQETLRMQEQNQETQRGSVTGQFCRVVRGKLSVRMILMMLLMWLCNTTYG